MKAGKRSTRILSMILSIALIFGMAPDMGLTVLAEGNGAETVISADAVSENEPEEGNVSEDEAETVPGEEDEEGSASENEADTAPADGEEEESVSGNETEESAVSENEAENDPEDEAETVSENEAGEGSVSEDMAVAEEELYGDTEDLPEEEIVAEGNAYDLWVGGVQVTDANKHDIRGVNGGKASYDPDNNTLTLSGVRGFKSYIKEYSGICAYIYAGEDLKSLVIKGDMDVTFNDENAVIYTCNELITYADLKIETAGTAIMNSRDRINLWEGNYDLKVNSKKPGSACIKCGMPGGEEDHLNIQYSQVRAVGGECAIYSYGSTTIGWKTKVYAEGDKYGIKCEDTAFVNSYGLRVEDMGELTAKATGLRTDRSTNDKGDYSGVWAGTKVLVKDGAIVYAYGDNHGIFSKAWVSSVDSGRIHAVSNGWSDVIPQSTCFTGIKAGSYIRIDDAYLTARGPHGAMLVVGTTASIKLENLSEVTDPYDATISSLLNKYDFGPYLGQTFVHSWTGAPVHSICIEPDYGYKPVPHAYDLYVGSVAVTDNNKNNIPISKGTASYDPDTNTLTFDNAEVNSSSYNHTGVDAAIYWGERSPLNIRGKLTISDSSGFKYGIYSKNDHLDMTEADITAKGIKGAAIYAFSASIWITDSNIDVSSEDRFAIYAANSVMLDSSYIKAASKDLAIMANSAFGGLHHENEKIIIPGEGQWAGYWITSSGGEKANTVIIEPEEPYGLYIGDQVVTPENKGDVLGDGKVKYDPETKTLTLKNPSIKGEHKDSIIYSSSDLRIEGNMKASTGDTWIRCEGKLTIAGDFDISSSSTVINADSLLVERGSISLENRNNLGYAVYAGNIEIFGGNLKVTGKSGGMHSYADGIRFYSGNVEINTESKNALYLSSTAKEIGFYGGHVKAVSDLGSALYTEPFIADCMCVITPEDTEEISGESMIEIADKDLVECRVSFEMNGYGSAVAGQTLKGGDKVAKPADPHDENGIFAGWYKDEAFTEAFDFEKGIIKDTVIYAKWYPKEDYFLFVGDTYVSCENCMDIYGDGTASYDPTNNTLTLKDYKKSDKYYSFDDKGNRAFIWAKQDITVKGSATLSSNLVNAGIRSESGSITLDGDIDISVNCDDENGYAASFSAMNGDINIEGGKINGRAGGKCPAGGIVIGNGKITVNGGDTKLTGNIYGIFGLMGSLEVNGGNLDAEASYKGNDTEESIDSVGIMMIGGSLIVNAGTIRAKGDSVACAFTTVSKSDEYIDIVKPEHGKLVKEGDGMVFMEADGKTYAKEVELTRAICTIRFNYSRKIDNRFAIIYQKVYKGDKATSPRKPIANGYRFKGWYKEKECINEFDFENEIILEDATLYAGWSQKCTVSFNVADADVATPESQEVFEGDTITDPGMGDITGRRFAGWYTDEALTKKYDFASPVESSFTLYAKWEKEKLSVSFNANGHGTAPETVTIEYGDKVAEPGKPEADGYSFAGWYTEESCINLYNFLMPVTKDITLYAKWVEAGVRIWTVSFDLNGVPGETPHSQSVADGETVMDPGTIFAEGLVFEGWYTDKEGTLAYDFEAAVTTDFTLYAKWTHISAVSKNTVTFDLQGKGSNIIKNVVSGNTVARPDPDPAAEGYIFTGWYEDKELTVEYGFDTPVIKDIVIYAGWTATEPGPDPVPDPDPVTSNSALDPMPVINDATEMIYLVKGQKFTLDSSWSIQDNDRASYKAYKKVISVSKKGAVNAKKAGDAVLVKKDVSGNVVMSVSVNVSAPSLSNKKLKLETGVEGKESGSIELKCDPNIKVYYCSGSPDVAVVDQNGNVTAVAKGSAKVTAYANGKAYTATVTVKEHETVRNRTMHITVDTSRSISVKGVKKWSSEDNTIAEMNKKGSKVTAKNAGITQLSASANGVDYTISLYAEDLTVIGEKITPEKKNKYRISLKAGESTMIDLPAVHQDVIFKNSKPDSAFIDEDGNVYARSKGKSKFTAKINGKIVTITVTVD